MKQFATAAAILALLIPLLPFKAVAQNKSCSCAVEGRVAVDSLFRAIPADLINIEKVRQNDKPTVLDRANGFLSITYIDRSGNSTMYTAALYTGGTKNKRVFLMVAREIHPIAQMASTEGFWIFEYAAGKCSDVTDELRPWKEGGVLVKLPRHGTDLERCEYQGVENGIQEVCTTYAWDLAGARFREKKKK